MFYNREDEIEALQEGEKCGEATSNSSFFSVKHIKSLITITTCNRLHEVKKYILPYIDFCNHNEDFDFLLSLDGNNTEYLDFCNEFHIPLLYSDEREGVGLSKNRVVTQFSDYDYYFFIEDDVELIDTSIFQENIDFSVRNNIPHLCPFIVGECCERVLENGIIASKGYKSSAQFNFFEAKALFQVGGWNTLFAKYKRFGHSEHSYRFYYAKLQDYPFIALENTSKKFVVHDPPHVTQIECDCIDNHYHPDEKALIDEKHTYFPLQTLSKFHYNNFDMNFNTIVAEYLQQNQRKYPLVKGKERRKCFGGMYLYKAQNSKTWFVKWIYLFLSAILFSKNSCLRYYIKQELRLV